ncbi:uncharacterized protein PAC_08988 [Phialocephala subalpina]|uniref:DUF6594 domain-containing protein n=1 Tax=Phialocephala subalpina TaxID=576137 RepID=A0A1L7X237_9HELO|nr:uncharacterized protein PAC_08988 [Phialocephala subalpina]
MDLATSDIENDESIRVNTKGKQTIRFSTEPDLEKGLFEESASDDIGETASAHEAGASSHHAGEGEEEQSFQTASESWKNKREKKQGDSRRLKCKLGGKLDGQKKEDDYVDTEIIEEEITPKVEDAPEVETAPKENEVSTEQSGQEGDAENETAPHPAPAVIPSKLAMRRGILKVFMGEEPTTPTKGSSKKAKKTLESDFEEGLRQAHGERTTYSQDGSTTALTFKYGNKWTYSNYLGRHMHNYVRLQALNEWEEIKKFALIGRDNDPFIITNGKTINRAVLNEVITKWRSEARSSLEPLLDADFPASSTLPPRRDRNDKYIKVYGRSRIIINRLNDKEQLLKRIGMAPLGGAFLIGPMLIMVLHKSLHTTLLTTSICVAGFGLVMAVFLEDHFDILSGIAAYAAVLVVFVGTSGDGS